MRTKEVWRAGCACEIPKVVSLVGINGAWMRGMCVEDGSIVFIWGDMEHGDLVDCGRGK